MELMVICQICNNHLLQMSQISTNGMEGKNSQNCCFKHFEYSFLPFVRFVKILKECYKSTNAKNCQKRGFYFKTYNSNIPVKASIVLPLCFVGLGDMSDKKRYCKGCQSVRVHSNPTYRLCADINLTRGRSDL